MRRGYIPHPWHEGHGCRPKVTRQSLVSCGEEKTESLWRWDHGHRDIIFWQIVGLSLIFWQIVVHCGILNVKFGELELINLAATEPKQRSTDLWRANQLVSVPLRLPGRILHYIRAYWVNLLSIWAILDVSGPIWNSVINRVWNCSALSPEAMCLVPRCLQRANSIHARQPVTCESGPEPMPQAHLSRDVKSVKSVKLLDTVPYCTGWAGNQQIAFRLAAPVTCKSKLTVCIAEGSLQWHGAQINCKSGEHPIGSNWVLHRALFIPRLHDEGAHGSILILAHSKRVQLAQHQTGQHQSCCWAIPDVTPYSRSNIFRRSKRKKAASLSECAFGCYTPLSRFMIASLMITNDHLESMIRDCVCSGWKKGFHAFNGGRIWHGWMAWTWLGRSSGGFSLLQPASGQFTSSVWCPTNYGPLRGALIDDHGTSCLLVALDKGCSQVIHPQPWPWHGHVSRISWYSWEAIPWLLC